MSVNEWINKMKYVRATEYYSALKRKEILTQATTWMNLEDIMLSEISQSQKDKYCRANLYEVPGVVRFHRDKRQMGVARGWREKCG